MRHTRTSLILLIMLAARVSFGQGASVEETIKHAVQMQQAGDYAAAADSYKEALKSRPNDVATHVNLGVVLVQLGQFAEAISQYEAADKLLPNDPRIQLNLALAYEKSGHIQEAVKRLEVLRQSDPQAKQATMLLADGYLQLGDNDKVIALIQPVAQDSPGDLAVAYMLGTALLREHRTSESEIYLDRIFQKGDTAEARFLLGTRMFESGDYPASVKQLKAATDLNPQLPQLQALYGRALLNTGDPDAALTAFQAELAFNPNDYDANLGSAQILAVRQKFDEAAKNAQHALLIRPDSLDAKLALAESLNGKAKFQEARAIAENVVRAQPQSVEAHQALAASYQGLDMIDRATQEKLAARKLRTASDPGPSVGSPAPTFQLPSANDSAITNLADFRGKTPVVLVFGSYSCPNFRGSAEQLISLYRRFGKSIPFLLIYIREAHASDNWQSTRNERENLFFSQASTMAEKEQHAQACSRKLHLPFPALVDEMDGKVEQAYSAWPSRAFIVDRAGTLRYSTRLTELEFDPREMAAVLEKMSRNK
jgi:tetratricopeptide (TPR) repeat protein